MVEAAVPPNPTARSASGEYVRAAELSALQAKYESDEGGAVLVHGPRGVGKGHLIGELIRHAELQGHSLVLQGRALGAGASSFHAFAQIVRRALTWAESVGAAEALVDPVFSDLEPVLQQSDGARATHPSVDQKLRFFEGVRRLLAAIAERTRVLVVVHGLERADLDTLELATYLADNLFSDSAFEPGTARPGLLALIMRDDATVSDRARDFLANARERRAVQTLRLDGLDLDGLRRYVQSPRVLQKLLEASEGLPSEIDELIDALPSNVEELFRRRLDATAPTTREMLAALAVYGRPASARMLAAVTQHPVQQVAKALAEQREARVLERKITNGEIQFAYARGANQEVTHKSTSAQDLERHHGGWARALAAEPGHGNASLLAHHQLRSAEPARGVPLAVKAAESHTVAGAFDSAAQLLEDALPHAKGELRVAILERLSELASLRGQPRAAIRYLGQLKDAVPEDQRGQVLRREAEILNGGGDHDAALETIELARAANAGACAIDRAAIEAAACEAQYQLGHLDAARATGEAALTMLDEAASDDQAMQRIALLNLLGKIALARDDVASAQALFGDTRALAERCAISKEEARGLLNVGFAQLRQGDLPAAEANLRLGLDKARDNNDLRLLAFGNLNLGVLAHQKGELGVAIDHYRACRSLFSRLGNRTQLARALYNLGNLFYLTGDMRRAQSHNDEALRLAVAGKVERLAAIAGTLDGLLLAERGEREAAEARLRDAMLKQSRLGEERPVETMVELADIQLRAGDTARATDTLDEAARTIARLSNKQLEARAALLRGRAMLAAGDDTALDALLAARDAIERLGERLPLRDAELAVGSAYASLGRKEVARMHYAAAAQIQLAVAAELPADLRATFESARPQAELTAAIAALDHVITTDLPPPVRQPISVAPAERKPEWGERYGAIIGTSRKLHKVFKILDRVSKSESTVLVIGESGTGKELVAEAIHRNSPRAKGPFVKLNCAALVESLLLSELFGHERGSFTGAHQRKVGRFEMAAGGTIFLDEIGDISQKTQVSLLRVLQEFEFERVGGGRSIKLEARVICATNRNLGQMVREGTFREDLYYRLKGLSVDLPSLRDRAEDIPMLAQHFLDRYAEESGTVEKALSPDSAATLEQYAWPGNVRELENVIRSVALFADGQTIERSDFDDYRELFEDSPAFEQVLGASRPTEPLAAAVSPPTTPPAAPLYALPPPADARRASEPAAPPESVLIEQIFELGVPLAELKRRIQDEAIAHALRVTKGNITRAAEMLGMKRPRLSQIINASEVLKQLCQGVGR